jgi:hypothetical protein
MPQRLAALRAAHQAAGAARHRLALRARDVRAALRTAPRQSHLARVPRAQIRHHAHHFRDHVAGAAHHHRVADAHVLARQLVHVVQRHVADRNAADEHRLEARHGRERTGAPDLELHVAHDRGLLLRRELVRNGPARRAGDEAEVALPVEAVDLVDDAIDVVAERFTLPPHAGVVIERPLDACDHLDLRAGAQSEFAQ